MTYRPIQLGARTQNVSVMGSMPLKGTNLRDSEQLLDSMSALWIENYWVAGEGELIKRKGTTVHLDTTESDLITLFKDYRNDYRILGYGQKVRAYNTVSKTYTDIKTDFTASNGGFSGCRAGDYFFVTSVKDGLWRIAQQMTYSQYQNLSGQNVFTIPNTGGAIGATITGSTSLQTANVVSSSGTTTLTVIVDTLSGNFTQGETITSGSLTGATLSNINPFTVGKTITGATSGAKGIILEHTDGGATGTLVLGTIVGTFVNGEVLTDDNSPIGQGTSTSAMTFQITLVSGAPKAKYVEYLGNRLFLFNLATDPAGWVYSDADTGTNPPFTNYTTATGYNSPGGGTYRNGVTATSMVMIGDVYMITFTHGWYAFRIAQTDIGGVSSKYDEKVQTSDLGINKAFMTEVGVIAVGSFGVRQLVSMGSPDMVYSEQWETLTEQLGQDYFKDVNFDDADIAYDDVRGYAYISCSKGGTTENLILAIRLELAGVESSVKAGATSFFTGLNPYKFFKDTDGTLYFTSSIDGVVYELFDGENDNGQEIFAQYYQELNFKNLTSTFNLDEFKIFGELSPASSLTIYFDTFDESSYFQSNRRNYTWTTSNSYTGGGGWGGSKWSGSGWTGGGTLSGLVYSKARMSVGLRNLTRVRVRIECADTADHVLSIFSALGTIVAPTRNNTLQAN